MNLKKPLLMMSAAGLMVATSVHAGTWETFKRWGKCQRRSPIELDLTADQLATETVKGPVTLEFKNVNRLRYEVKIGSTVTLTPGPDISPFRFVPAVPTAAPTPTTPAAPTPPPGPAVHELAVTPLDVVNDRVQRIKRDLAAQRTEVNRLLGLARTALSGLDTQLKEVERLVRESDSTLASGGEQALLSLVQTREAAVRAALPNLVWPDPDSLRNTRSAVSALAAELAELPLVEPAFSQWAQAGDNRDLFRGLQSFAKQLLANLDTLEAGSEQRKAFDKQLADLVSWHGILTRNLGNRSFHETIPVRCGYPFVESKRTQFKVVKADRLEADKTKATRESVLITVDCPTSVTVSGGIGVTDIDETDIKLISAPSDDGSKTVTRIAFEDRGDKQVNPLFLINTRLTEGQGCNWHLAAGTVLDIDNPSSNVALGYVLGPSLSLRDNIYLSAGIQFGRVAKLTGGAYEGQIVPEGLAKPPIERSWDHSWFFAVSFKIR
jgi:hypothetical protein